MTFERIYSEELLGTAKDRAVEQWHALKDHQRLEDPDYVLDGPYQAIFDRDTETGELYAAFNFRLRDDVKEDDRRYTAPGARVPLQITVAAFPNIEWRSTRDDSEIVLEKTVVYFDTDDQETVRSVLHMAVKAEGQLGVLFREMQEAARALNVLSAICDQKAKNAPR